MVSMKFAREIFAAGDRVRVHCACSCVWPRLSRPRTHLATSFPGSLILPPNGTREDRPWLSLVSCHLDNWDHQGRVLCNQEICWVELCQSIALRPPLPVIISLWAEISNSIYSNVYLKVKQLCLEAICRGRAVTAVLPIGYMESQSYLNCGRRAAQFHPVVIVVVSALDQIDTENIIMSVERRTHVAFLK